MRLTQAEIRTSRLDDAGKLVDVSKVYWLPDDPYNDRGVRAGSMVTLAEEGCFTHWIVAKTMCSVSDDKKQRAWLVASLKAKIGTILELVSV